MRIFGGKMFFFSFTYDFILHQFGSNEEKFIIPLYSCKGANSLKFSLRYLDIIYVIKKFSLTSHKQRQTHYGEPKPYLFSLQIKQLSMSCCL